MGMQLKRVAYAVTRPEDIETVKTFKKICARLNISMSKKIKEWIESFVKENEKKVE